MEDKYFRIVNSVIVLVLLLTATILNRWEHVNFLWDGVWATSLILAGSFGTWMLSTQKYLKTIFAAMFVKKLRISCSYLYKIKVDDLYLLIKSKKHGKFQPVGGNFKRNKYSSSFLHEIEIEKDECFTNGGRSADDLRLFIKGCDLPKFLKWYNAPNKQREVSYDREFYEELVESNYFDGEVFPFPRIDFRKQIVTSVRYSEHLKCKEVHIYDIVELMPTHKQEKFLKQLKSRGNTDNFIWIDGHTIQNEGYQQATKNSNYHITDHSKEILV